MAYPRTHLYLTWGGTAWGDEIWQNGVRFDRATTVDEAELEVAADAIATWFTVDSGANFSDRVLLSWVKAALIGTDGRYPDNAEATLYEYESPFPGSYTGSGAVPQVSIAVTFDTFRRRGLAHQGRIYLPPTAIAANTTGRHGQGPTIAAGVVALLSDLQDALGAQAVIAASGKSEGKPERAGVITSINGVRVGDVYDTQRRRRNRIAETYSPVVPLPPQ